MPLLKIKIRFPKLLLKSTRKRKPGCSETHNANCNKGKSWFKPKKFLAKHIGLVLSHSYCNKKSEDIVNPSLEGNSDKIDRAMRELSEQHGIQMTRHLQLAPADKEILSRREEPFNGRSSRRSVDAGKQVSFSDLFLKKIHKKTRFSFTNWRINEKKNVKVDEDKRIDSTTIGTSSVNLSENQGSSKKHLAGVPSRRYGGNRKRKNMKFMQKRVVQQGEESDNEEEKESRETELCKKKILMGEKCRPLNKSGTLNYDENGILLPEDTYL